MCRFFFLWNLSRWMMLQNSEVLWVPFQYPIRRLFLRSGEVSEAARLVLNYHITLEFDRNIGGTAVGRHCCWGACQISKWSYNSEVEYKSRGFETLWDLTIRHFIGYWNGAQDFIFIQIILFQFAAQMPVKFQRAHKFNNMNPGYFSLAATAMKPQQILMFLHISARVWGRRWSPHTSEQKVSKLKPQ